MKDPVHELFKADSTEPALRDECSRAGEHLYVRSKAELDLKAAGATGSTDLPVVFFMGGEGTRLRHLTGEAGSKHMLDIKGKPLCRYSFDMWRARGFSQFRILLDDGNMELRVVAVSGIQVRCRVVKGGFLGSNKGVNLPGAALTLPGFTDKDRVDLELGLELGIDMIALSFVQRAEDARPVREMLSTRRMRVPVLAKIEKPEALHHIDDILRFFDGIMVARGDLGVELSPEEAPVWQKTLIQRARQKGKATIVATQMLESMIQNPRPTRAEASDVANAVIDGTDAVMLSGETAVGSYPVEAVTVMARIIERAEAAYPASGPEDAGRSSNASAVAHAACSLAGDLGARAVVVLTRSGRTARLVSRARPPAPIIAITGREALARQLALWWDVTPVMMEFSETTEATLDSMERALLQQGLVGRGDTLIVVGATPFTAQARANFVKVHTVKSPPLTQAEG